MIHYYQNTIVATTLLYPDEVTDPSRFSMMKDLPEPGEEDLAPFMKIMDKLTVDLDLSILHDGHMERIEVMVLSKIKETLNR